MAMTMMIMMEIMMKIVIINMADNCILRAFQHWSSLPVLPMMLLQSLGKILEYQEVNTKHDDSCLVLGLSG